MSDRPVIDGFEFAAAGSSLSGRCALAALPRLQDRLVRDAGALDFELNGRIDRQGRFRLDFSVKGGLRTHCHRCLGVIEHPLDHHWELLLARSEIQIEQQPLELGTPDWTVGSDQMAVLDLIEDELLLQMPGALHHEVCSPPAALPERAKSSPFAGLQDMIKPGDRVRTKRSGSRATYRK